jgi:hypothetical protein
VGGREKIKFPKKMEIRGKKNREGGGKKIKLQKKLKSRLRKGKQKKSTWDGTWIKKRILLVHHHPHWCTSGCWFTLASSRYSY